MCRVDILMLDFGPLISRSIDLIIRIQLSAENSLGVVTNDCCFQNVSCLLSTFKVLMINLQCLKYTMSFYFWDSTLSIYDCQSHHTCSPVLCSATSLSHWQSRNVCVYYANGRHSWIGANHLSSSALAETAECENDLIKPHDNVTCISVCSPGPRQRRAATQFDKNRLSS